MIAYRQTDRKTFTNVISEYITIHQKFIPTRQK